MIRASAIFGTLAVVGGVLAQSPNYGQCGGIGWTGATTCNAGWVCQYSNDWYSQCVPGTSSSTVKTTSTSTVKTTSTSKSSSVATSTTKTSSTPTSTAAVKYLFSFGDSYTSTTFDITGTKPVVGNPLGNPPYPGYTACGSVPNWVDFNTIVYNKTTILTYNFAYGGATINATLVAPYEATVKSLIDQVTDYSNTVATKPSYAPWTAANAQASFFIGINDNGGSWWQADSFRDTLLTQYWQQVQKVYNSGVRNFIFFNVPPTDRSPLMISQGADTAAGLKTALASFNSKLQTKVSAFSTTFPGATAYYYDVATVVTNILNNPSSYGLQDATSYGDAANLAWCNNYHISSAVHKYVATNLASHIIS
jgi:phospholipase/lecithinase/hemolysin